MKLVSGLVLLMSVALSKAALGGVGVWTTNGPAGGANSLAIDPVGTLTAGLSIPPVQAMSKSFDSGTSWQPLPLTSWPLAAGPSGTIYAENIVPIEVDVSQGSLYKSSDGGNSWATLTQKQDTGFSVTLDPFQPSTLFRVDTITALGHPSPLFFGMLLRSNDGGATWTEVDAGLNLSASYISAFAPDPSTQGVFYAATAASQQSSAPVPPSRLYRTSDSGSSWTLIASSINGTITSLQVDPFSSATLYAGVLTGTMGGATGTYKSVDSGTTFQQINSLWVNTISMDPVRQGRVYLGTQADGVQASSDGGSSWAPMNSGLPNGIYPIPIYALAIDQRGEFLHAATGQSGVFDFQLVSSSCAADSHTLCLNNGRFAVTTDFQPTPEGPSSPATAVPLTTDTGYFWFFDPANIELVTKVLNGCATNGHYWFFAGGLTNVGVQINVTDTATGAVRSYSNPVGSAFQPIQDTAAFPCP
jgi:photosystem II stability/assembly factor-like uncharacterized protein